MNFDFLFTDSKKNGKTIKLYFSGNVQCMGEPLDLIDRFARGFTILIRVRHDILSPIEVLHFYMYLSSSYNIYIEH